MRRAARRRSRPGPASCCTRWLHVRAEACIAGPNLFPSTRSGKPWSKNGQYLWAEGVLEEAAVDSRAGGSFRLRHTFALRQLRRGAAPDQVARWLGIEPAAMARYGRLVGTHEHGEVAAGLHRALCGTRIGKRAIS